MLRLPRIGLLGWGVQPFSTSVRKRQLVLCTENIQRTREKSVCAMVSEKGSGGVESNSMCGSSAWIRCRFSSVASIVTTQWLTYPFSRLPHIIILIPECVEDSYEEVLHGRPNDIELSIALLKAHYCGLLRHAQRIKTLLLTGGSSSQAAEAIF